MIEQATVDCYNESEAIGGFHAMIEGHLDVPFTTTVLGVEVRVAGVDLDECEQIVAVCVRGKTRQAIPLLELPLPPPAPAGSEWIEAYRAWVRGAC